MGSEPAGRSRPAGSPGPALRTLTGASLGWIVMPFLVLAASLAARSASPDWLVPGLAGGILAGGAGVVIGAAGLGWPGLAGAVVGAIGGALLPFLVFPPLLGFAGYDRGEAYGGYLPGMLVAVAVAIVGMVVGRRSGRRIALRPAVALGLGLLVLAAWCGCWFVLMPSLGRAA